MNTLSQIKELLTSVGLKATHQRLVILEALRKMDNHPTIDQIYSQVSEDNPSISLATVYKTTEALVEKGLLAKVSTPEGLMRYDARLDSHGHIYCTNTKELVDFYDDELDQLIIEFFKRKKVNNLKIKNISVRINGEKLDPRKNVVIK